MILFNRARRTTCIGEICAVFRIEEFAKELEHRYAVPNLSVL